MLATVQIPMKDFNIWGWDRGIKIHHNQIVQFSQMVCIILCYHCHCSENVYRSLHLLSYDLSIVLRYEWSARRGLLLITLITSRYFASLQTNKIRVHAICMHVWLSEGRNGNTFLLEGLGKRNRFVFFFIRWIDYYTVGFNYVTYKWCVCVCAIVYNTVMRSELHLTEIMRNKCASLLSK